MLLKSETADEEEIQKLVLFPEHIHWRRAMKNSRRMKRMARNRKKMTSLNLTSLMDVFTILVFFLLFNSGSGEVLEAPREIKLPDSAIEMKPRETIVILVSPDMVLVQGELVASMADVLNSKARRLP